MLNPDILANIYFYGNEKQGRKSPTPSNFYSCIFVLQGNNYDCRLLLDKIGSISPGEMKEKVPIKFLSPDLVLPKIAKGDAFYLREINNIAEGKILEILYAVK